MDNITFKNTPRYQKKITTPRRNSGKKEEKTLFHVSFEKGFFLRVIYRMNCFSSYFGYFLPLDRRRGIERGIGIGIFVVLIGGKYVE